MVSDLKAGVRSRGRDCDERLVLEEEALLHVVVEDDIVKCDLVCDFVFAVMMSAAVEMDLEISECLMRAICTPIAFRRLVLIWCRVCWQSNPSWQMLRRGNEGAAEAVELKRRLQGERNKWSRAQHEATS